jgi:hypothetical protein
MQRIIKEGSGDGALLRKEGQDAKEAKEAKDGTFSSFASFKIPLLFP